MNRLFLSVASVLLGSASLAAGPLGLGFEADVLVRHNATLNGVHIHGVTVVGGNLALTGNMSEFGNRLPQSAGASGLAVNGQISLGADGRLLAGRAIEVTSLKSGQSVRGTDLIGGGRSLYAQKTEVGATGFDVEAAFTGLIALSKSLAALPSTLTAASLTSGDYNNRQLNLVSNSASPFEVLNLTGQELSTFKNIQVASPTTNSGLIINVDLTGYTGGAFVQNRNGSDAGADQILWNFFGAPSVTFERQFYGSILAPEMAVTHNGNDFKGGIFAAQFTKKEGQVHIHRYQGDLPPPPAVPDSGASFGLLAVSLLGLVMLRRRR